MTGPVVAATAGAVAGRRSGDGVLAFLGIPYGAPTGGEARFRPPTAAAPWSGVRECTHYGPSSPPTLSADDRAFFPRSPLWSVYAGIDPRIPFSEDCLRLNVWTASADPAAGRPVIVWLHGGGFSWGSGSSPLTAGDVLARDHDVVVVTVNHRLGVLGYLHVPDSDADGTAEDGWADSGVAGLLDLRLALRWVRDNIRAFGGDPDNVTIAGHSGGSAKVACLLALPSARGLFRRAIVMSGVVTLRSMTRSEAAASTEALLAATGLRRRDVAALRSLPVERLTEAAAGLRFRPVVGEPSLPAHPFDPVAAPSAAGIELLTGVAKDDSATFKYDSDPAFRSFGDADLLERVAGLPGVNGPEAARALVDEERRRLPGADARHLLVAITTRGLRERTVLMAERKLAQSDAAVWMYEFAYDIVMPDDTPFPGELMSPHGAELPFVFDLAEREWLAGRREDRIGFGHRVSGYMANFARTGDPNGDGLPPWPRYELDSRRVLVLDASREAADESAVIR